jgi:UDPglucose 6-dehydrogenase
VRVGVIGIGHVGLPTAAVLAKLGHEVVATDNDEEKLALLGKGVIPFFEPGLKELVRTELEQNRLEIVSDANELLPGCHVVFICVGTPPRATGEANLAAMEKAAEIVARQATGPLVVVEKSTVPAGTAEHVRRTLARHRSEDWFAMVSNPEFLREGNAVRDTLQPSRILVGSDSPRALQVMRELYDPVVQAGAVWIQTDLATAELAKHACNAFLALKISYANALARVCELAGADVTVVADVMGSDPRIGRPFLDAGLGYGGYCFPKDLSAFDQLVTRLGYSFPLLKEIARINEEAIEAAFAKANEALWNFDGKRVALLGLAFKPGTDDTRFAPALSLARRLLEAGASVVGYDPRAGANAKAEIPEMELTGDSYSALEGAHCAIICTEWEEFRSLDLQRVRESMSFPIIVDGRNIYDPETMSRLGFTYLPMGRPAVEPRR